MLDFSSNLFTVTSYFIKGLSVYVLIFMNVIYLNMDKKNRFVCSIISSTLDKISIQ